MSDMERRCYKAASDAIGADGCQTLDIVRAVLAEAGVAELVEAATALRNDMVSRAQRDAHLRDGDIVVEAGSGVWNRFCTILAKIGATQ